MNRKPDSLSGSKVSSKSRRSSKSEIRNESTSNLANFESPVHNTRAVSGLLLSRSKKICTTATLISKKNKSQQLTSSNTSEDKIMKNSSGDNTDTATPMKSAKVPSKTTTNGNICTSSKKAIPSYMHIKPSTSKDVLPTLSSSSNTPISQKVPLSGGATTCEDHSLFKSYLSSEYKQRLLEKASISEKDAFPTPITNRRVALLKPKSSTRKSLTNNKTPSLESSLDSYSESETDVPFNEILKGMSHQYFI